MAITKLGRDKYLIRVYRGRDRITKKRRSFNETFRGTHREAEKREEVLKVEARRRPGRCSPDMSVKEFIESYLEDTANRRSESSQRRLRELLYRYVVPYIGALHISKVDTSVIQQLLNFLSAPKRGDANGETHKEN